MTFRFPHRDVTLGLLTDLLNLVRTEQAAGHERLLAIWQRPIGDKLDTGWSQDFTHLERGPDVGSLWAYPGEAESRFREGDMLMLHSGSAVDGMLGRGLAFELEDDDRWLLRGRRALEVLDAWQGGTCYADPDAIDLTRWYEDAINELATSDIGQDIALPLLAGTLDITFDDRDVTAAEAIAKAEGMDAAQARAVGKALGAHHVACIQGPPGTGKTRVLALAVRLMVERGERVLVTSHTHMAINNALNKVHAQGVPVAKVGRLTQCKGLDDAVARFEGIGEWPDPPAAGPPQGGRAPSGGSERSERGGLPTNGWVVGATPFATMGRRLEGCTFDTVVFDEASQVTAPLALMAMRKARRYVFVGDQAQLPPVLLSRSVLADDAPSMFATLTSRQSDHVEMLERTYRMNRWLTEWPSRTYYRGVLEADGKNRDRRLSLEGLDNAPPQVARVLDPAACGVFVPTLDPKGRSRNWRDAALVRDLCSAAHAGGLALEHIGIVTPYRSQGRAIRKLLIERFGRDAARRVVADTVERMQGQERELIILSLATGDAAYLEQVASFFFQAERLNVSITRAKTKLIVIGPWVDSPPEVEHEKLRRWIGEYVDLQRHLVRVDVAGVDGSA
jgi:DNA replication ATP-dependent helicase Dna2